MKMLLRKLQFKHVKGFTLIEVLVAVIILGVLAAIAIPGYQKMIKRSYVSDGLNVLDMFANAQNKYFIEHGMYARSLGDLKTPLNGKTENAKLQNIHTSNFDYNKEENRHCITASSNRGNYTLVRNYQDNKIFCIGQECEEFSGYVNKLDKNEYSEYCPIDLDLVSGNDTEQEGVKTKGSSGVCERPCDPANFDATVWNSNETCSDIKDSGKGSGGNDPGYNLEPCGIYQYSTICVKNSHGEWCESVDKACVPKDCEKLLGPGFHLAEGNYPGFNRCACVKDCGNNTCSFPNCKKRICDPNTAQGGIQRSRKQSQNNLLSTCGVQNIINIKEKCNYSTGILQCLSETDECQAVIPDGLGDSCDGRPEHANAVEGNSCGIKKIDLCRLNDSCSGVDTTLKCGINDSLGYKCFTGETTTTGCPNGQHKICNDCKWSSCTKCDPATKPVSQNKECLTNDGRCGIKTLTEAYCDENTGSWIFVDDPNAECDGQYGNSPNPLPPVPAGVGNCFKQNQEWQCRIDGWTPVATGPYFTDQTTGVWVGGGLMGQGTFYHNNCSNDNKDINGNPLPEGTWCENCIQHRCADGSVNNIHYGNKCWVSVKDSYTVYLHNNILASSFSLRYRS